MSSHGIRTWDPALRDSMRQVALLVSYFQAPCYSGCVVGRVHGRLAVALSRSGARQTISSPFSAAKPALMFVLPLKIVSGMSVGRYRPGLLEDFRRLQATEVIVVETQGPSVEGANSLLGKERRRKEEEHTECFISIQTAASHRLDCSITVPTPARNFHFFVE